MGKSKQRSFRRGVNSPTYNMTREDAIVTVIKLLSENSREAENLITLFGLGAEELLEAGASYEIVKSKEGLLK